MSKTTMAFLAATAFIAAALLSLEARMSVVLPIAFALAGLALAVRAFVLWKRGNA